MTSIPTPPTSTSPSPSPSPTNPPTSTTTTTTTTETTTTLSNNNHEDLLTHLDDLLETYLDRLDTYQRLRAQLSKNLAGGFLSLAEANRTGNLGSGRRYGEERYDERMKAGRRVEIKDGKMVVVYNASTVEDGKEEEGEEEEEEPTKQDEEIEKPNNTTDDPGSTQKKTKRSHPAISNPLTWYGILIPPSLRTAQTCFTDAVDGQLAQLLSVRTEMVELERRVARAREEAGLEVEKGGGERGFCKSKDVD